MTNTLKTSLGPDAVVVALLFCGLCHFLRPARAVVALVCWGQLYLVGVVFSIYGECYLFFLEVLAPFFQVASNTDAVDGDNFITEFEVCSVCNN